MSKKYLKNKMTIYVVKRYQKEISKLVQNCLLHIIKQDLPLAYIKFYNKLDVSKSIQNRCNRMLDWPITNLQTYSTFKLKPLNLKRHVSDAIHSFIRAEVYTITSWSFSRVSTPIGVKNKSESAARFFFEMPGYKAVCPPSWRLFYLLFGVLLFFWNFSWYFI